MLVRKSYKEIQNNIIMLVMWDSGNEITIVYASTLLLTYRLF